MLFKRYPGLELAFSLLGALFLLWMAWKSWQASRQSQAPAHTSPPSNVIHGAAWDGFAVAFLNPKVALFFLALFSQFLSSEMGQPARIQIALTAMIIDGAWYVLVALLLGRSRFLPWLREHHHWVERGTAVLLVVIACSVVTQTLWLDPPALTWG